MAEPIKVPKLTLDPKVEASILEQEKNLTVIKRMRDDAKLLGLDTIDMDKYVELAERIIVSTKDSIARIKKL